MPILTFVNAFVASHRSPDALGYCAQNRVKHAGFGRATKCFGESPPFLAGLRKKQNARTIMRVLLNVLMLRCPQLQAWQMLAAFFWGSDAARRKPAQFGLRSARRLSATQRRDHQQLPGRAAEIAGMIRPCRYRKMTACIDGRRSSFRPRVRPGRRPVRASMARPPGFVRAARARSRRRRRSTNPGRLRSLTFSRNPVTRWPVESSTTVPYRSVSSSRAHRKRCHDRRVCAFQEMMFENLCVIRCQIGVAIEHEGTRRRRIDRPGGAHRRCPADSRSHGSIRFRRPGAEPSPRVSRESARPYGRRKARIAAPLDRVATRSESRETTDRRPAPGPLVGREERSEAASRAHRPGSRQDNS